MLFLDGVDLLAKHDPEMCSHLLKCLLTKVVLVSSEGTIMPLAEKLSAMDEKAMIYLKKNKISEDIARKLVDLIGGRIVHLKTCAYIRV